MSNNVPLYQFRMKASKVVSYSYYKTPLVDAIPITVIAETLDQAKNKAIDTLGKPGLHSSLLWVLDIDTIEEINLFK